MANEHDAWLGRLGVDVGSLLAQVVGSATGAAQAAGGAGAGVARTVGAVASHAAPGVEKAPGSSVASAAAVMAPARHGLGGFAETAKDVGRGVYQHMKDSAGAVKEGETWVDDSVDWLEDKAKSGTGWVADKAEGIPVLEQVAGAGKTFVDTQIDEAGGAVKGATDLAGSLVGMAADPVDTVIGLEKLSEHIPVTGTAQKMVHGMYDLAFTDKKADEVIDDTFNPRKDIEFLGAMGESVASPMSKAIEEGKPGEAFGQVAVAVASMFVGTGEAGMAGKGALAADGAVAAEGATAAKGATLADAAEAAKGATAADGAAAAKSAGGAGRSAEGGTAAHGAQASGEAGAAAGEEGAVLRRRKPTITADPTMGAGTGSTDKYGNIKYSSAGTQAEQDLARIHEQVHSFLSPKMEFLRDFRADLNMSLYQRSALLKYIEEALSECVAQLKVNGVKGLFDGIRFPIKGNYVTIGRVAGEAIGVVVVAGVSITIYVIAKD